MKEFCFGSFPVILDIVREWMRGAQYSHDVPFEVLEHLQGLGQIAAGFALGKCKFLAESHNVKSFEIALGLDGYDLPQHQLHLGDVVTPFVSPHTCTKE